MIHKPIAFAALAAIAISATPAAKADMAPILALLYRFDTLAFDADFSKPLPKGWLGGCPNDADYRETELGDGLGHTWYNNIWYSPKNAPCDAGQVYEPLAGKMVLDIPWTVSGDNYIDGIGHTLQTASWWYNGVDAGDAISFPNNAYYEISARFDPVETGVRLTLNTWPLTGIYSQALPGIEWDVVEETIEDGPYGVAHNFGNGFAQYIWSKYSASFPSYDFHQYHKIGLRTTSDGHTVRGCGFVDGRLMGCQETELTDLETTQRLFLVLASHCDIWHQPDVVCPVGRLQHVYVQYIRVWSCKDWETSQCNQP